VNRQIANKMLKQILDVCVYNRLQVRGLKVTWYMVFWRKFLLNYRGTNISLIGALSLDGLIATMTLPGSINTQVFVTYVQQVLAPQLWPGAKVIMDNQQSTKLIRFKKFSIWCWNKTITSWNLPIMPQQNLCTAEFLDGEITKFLKTNSKSAKLSDSKQ